MESALIFFAILAFGFRNILIWSRIGCLVFSPFYLRYYSKVQSIVKYHIFLLIGYFKPFFKHISQKHLLYSTVGRQFCQWTIWKEANVLRRYWIKSWSCISACTVTLFKTTVQLSCHQLKCTCSVNRAKVKYVTC